MIDTIRSTTVFPRNSQVRSHTLRSTPETVRVGILDSTASPALAIDSGDVVFYPDTWLHWGNQVREGMTFEEREPIRKRYLQGPYSNVGPVVVNGAQPGDVIECRMLRLKPIEWGWNSFTPGIGALPHDFDRPYLHYFRFNSTRTATEFVSGIELPLAPIQGVMAVEPAGDQPTSAILTGAHGGNLNLRELVEGTALFLPVFKAGGRVWTSDSHAVQGDGVVDQTSIETAMEELQIQYVLHKNVSLSLPLVETPTHWIGFGFGSSLDEAIAACVRNLVDWLSQAAGLAKPDAYALCSLAVSFRVTQYANQTNSNYSSAPAKTIHGMVPKQIFPAELLDRIAATLRPEIRS